MRIRTAINKILKEIREVASSGGREIMFTPSGLRYMTEICEVRHMLMDLGYTIDKDDSDEWEIIRW